MERKLEMSSWYHLDASWSLKIRLIISFGAVSACSRNVKQTQVAHVKPPKSPPFSLEVGGQMFTRAISGKGFW